MDRHPLSIRPHSIAVGNSTSGSRAAYTGSGGSHRQSAIGWSPRRNRASAGPVAARTIDVSRTDTHRVRPSRADLVDRYRRNRARSRQLFALLSDEAYYSQPIALRHPVVFYDGHLPGFSFNTLVKKALGGPSIDARLEDLFARGIDPHEATAAGARAPGARVPWPSREVVRSFADEADRRVLDALQHADLDRPGHPLLDRGEAVFAILEHEEMHQETLLYMWHRLPFAQKTAPAGVSSAHRRRPRAGGVGPRSRGPRDAGRRSRRDAVRLGQRVSGVRRSTCRASRSSATT